MTKPKKKKKTLSDIFIDKLKGRVSKSKFNEGGKKDFLGVNRNKRLNEVMNQ